MKMVEIARYGSSIEASIGVNALELMGIKGVLTGEASKATFVGMGAVAGEIRLSVEASNADRAREILKDLQSDSLIAPWKCQSCGAEVDAGFEICWSCGAPSPQINTGV